VSHPLRTSALIAAASALALGAIAPALAQEPAAPTPPTPPAPPAAAPAAPATPAAPGAAAPTTAAPDAAAAQNPAAAQPAAPVAPEPPAPPPPPPPELPTSGDGATVASILTNVCEPLVKGAKVDQLAKANGLKLDKKSQLYVLPLTPKTPYQIGLEDPGVNKNVCTLRIQYAQGGESEKQIRDTLNVWRYLHKPQMFLHRNEQAASITGHQAVTVTWDNRDNIAKDGEMYGLVFRQEKKPDGTSVGKNFDQGVVEFTVRTAASVGITPEPKS